MDKKTTISLAALLATFTATANATPLRMENIVRTGADKLGLKSGKLPLMHNTFTCSASAFTGGPDIITDDSFGPQPPPPPPAGPQAGK